MSCLTVRHLVNDSTLRQSRFEQETFNSILSLGSSMQDIFGSLDPGYDDLSTYNKIQEKLKGTEKEPRYEPFTNRTPLNCDEYSDQLSRFERFVLKEAHTNGIGNVCNPCGIDCTGKAL